MATTSGGAAPALPPGELERADRPRADERPASAGIVPARRPSARSPRRSATASRRSAEAAPAQARRRRCPSWRSRRCCATTCGSRRRRSGGDVDIHLGLGTCTMKYSPRVNEELVRAPAGRRPAPVPGRRDRAGDARGDATASSAILCEISGMDRFTFQPAGGTQGGVRERPHDPGLPLGPGRGRSATRSSRRSSRTRATPRRPATAGLQDRDALPGAERATRSSTPSRRPSPSAPPG